MCLGGSPNPLQLEYLHKIVELCEQQHIKLYFINTPIYQIDKYWDTEDFYKKIKTMFGNVEFLDYGRLQFPDSCYGDIDHLNYKGAKQFSLYLEKNFRSNPPVCQSQSE